MNKLIKQAFTLIELLVVIAIIGILSGLIVVSMGGMTQKATIAKAQVFSNSLRNSLMLNMIGEWKFDNINIPSTDKTPDTWNGVNNGTLKESGYAGVCDSTHCPQIQTTNCVSGNCLSFDGINDYVDCGNDNSLSTGKFTLSWWIKPNVQTGSHAGIISKVGNDNGQWKVYFHSNTNLIRFVNAYSGSGVAFNNVFDEKWQHWTVIADNYSLIAYKNGEKIVDTTLVAQTVANNQPLYIGTAVNSGDNSYRFYYGLIDDIKIFNAILSASQIKEHYYAGLNSLLAKGSISASNYQERLLLTANK